LRRFLDHAAGPAGALLILDDLQWASGDALELIAALLRRANGSLRVVAYRDDEVGPNDSLTSVVADLMRAGLAARHPLAPLSETDSARLLDALAPELAPPGRDTLLRRAEGIPFFLVSGALAARAGEPVEATPWDVAQSIRQRVARLPATTRTALMAAAIMGRRLAPDLLPRVVERPAPETADAIEMARLAGLLESTPDGGIRFAHDVIREVIEADAPPAHRAAFHRRIVAVLEGAGPGASGQIAVERLAYHCVGAGETERAVRYLARAADRAHGAAALQAEAALLGQAIALAEEIGRDGTVAELRVRRGHVHFESGRWDAARADLEAGLTGPSPLVGEPRCRALVTLAMVCHWLFDVGGTRRYAAEAQTLAEMLDRRDLAAQALSALAFADSSDGDIGSALARYRRAWDLAGPRHRRRLAPGAEMSGLIRYWRGDFASAVTTGQEAVRLARDVGDVVSTARALGNLGLALSGAVRYAEASEAFREARRFCGQHDLRQWLARSIAMEAGFHLAVFDFAEAEALAEEARDLSRSIGWPLAAVSSALDLLFCLARRGDGGARAEALLREAAEAAQAASGAHGWLWMLRLAAARAEIALARDDWEAAARAGDDAIGRARRHDRPKYEAFGLVARGRAAAVAGRHAAARDDLLAAVALARRIGDPALVLHVANACLAIDDDDRLREDARAAAASIVAALPDDAMRRRVEQADPLRRWRDRAPTSSSSKRGA
jgi:tetratricopeptide (TPR) repeat protein